MIILDASVILKWFQQEEDSERALMFEKRHINGEEVIGAPDLLLYEVTNVLRYGKHITEHDAEQILDVLARMEIQIFSFSFFELNEVLLFAREYGITVYDGLYVILAKRLQCDFVTADNALYKKLNGMDFVHLLSGT